MKKRLFCDFLKEKKYCYPPKRERERETDRERERQRERVRNIMYGDIEAEHGGTMALYKLRYRYCIRVSGVSTELLLFSNKTIFGKKLFF